jgi:hypothetical protein
MTLPEAFFDVVAVNIMTRSERTIAERTTERNAEAIIKFAVMWRGVDEEFYYLRATAATPRNEVG